MTPSRCRGTSTWCSKGRPTSPRSTPTRASAAGTCSTRSRCRSSSGKVICISRRGRGRGPRRGAARRGGRPEHAAGRAAAAESRSRHPRGPAGAAGEEAAGSLFPQGPSVGAGERLLEDTIPAGLRALRPRCDPRSCSTRTTRGYLDALPCALVALDGAGEGQRHLPRLVLRPRLHGRARAPRLLRLRDGRHGRRDAHARAPPAGGTDRTRPPRGEARIMNDTAPSDPTFHHFNLKTTRLQELIDWYSAVVGAEVTFQDATGAWLTNDAANHRIALLAFPGLRRRPRQGHPHRHAPQRVRVRALRGPQRELPAPARARASSPTSASTTA